MDRLRSAADPEFAEHAAGMGLHRVFADEQCRRDFAGAAASLVLFAGVGKQAPAAGAAAEAPPTLSLSASGDFQQSVHFNFDAASREKYLQPTFVAPLYALNVAPHDWLRVYTKPPLGLPRSARATIYLSEGPERASELRGVAADAQSLDIDRDLSGWYRRQKYGGRRERHHGWLVELSLHCAKSDVHRDAAEHVDDRPVRTDLGSEGRRTVFVARERRRVSQIRLAHGAHIAR